MLAARRLRVSQPASPIILSSHLIAERIVGIFYTEIAGWLRRLVFARWRFSLLFGSGIFQFGRRRLFRRGGLWRLAGCRRVRLIFCVFLWLVIQRIFRVGLTQTFDHPVARYKI